MLECLMCLIFLGLVLASGRRIGFSNPFQIYFLIWFLIIFGYYLSRETFIEVSLEFLLLMFAAKALALSLLIGIYATPLFQVKSKQAIFIPEARDRRVWLAQILVLIALPLAYQQAIHLADGDSIFTVLGYVKLRLALTENGESFGLLDYFTSLAFVLSSIQIYSYLAKKTSFLRLTLSVLISLQYGYLGTGRTLFLLLIILMVTPLITVKIIRFRGMAISVLLTIFIFIFVATLTGKGISPDADFFENIASFLDNLRGYTIAPWLALSQFIKSWSGMDFGLNTFRFFVSVLHASGLTNIAPIALIRDYEYIPDPTNVYTVYEAYFRDFWYFGIFIPPIFLIGHWWLYRKANRTGGVWVFYYSASIYPLVMQFFQDQYFSLLSMWIQFGFWYWFLLTPNNRLQNAKINHA